MLCLREALQKKKRLTYGILPKEGGGSRPIHNFEAHFLCLKSYGIFGENKGGGGSKHKFHKNEAQMTPTRHP